MFCEWWAERISKVITPELHNVIVDYNLTPLLEEWLGKAFERAPLWMPTTTPLTIEAGLNEFDIAL